MSYSAFSKATFYCHKCKQRTEHNAKWQSKNPNNLQIKCTVCKTSNVLILS